MKKIIITLAAMAIAVSSFAQASIGVGYANNSAKTTVSSAESTSATNGFYVEGTYTLSLGNFAIVPGLRYTYLTAKDAASAAVASIASGKITGTTNEHYIAVPVHAQYGFDLGGAKLYLFAGPTINVGLSSTFDTATTLSILGNATTKKGSTNLYGDNSEYSRFDILLGAGAGVEFGSFGIKAGYDFGLLDRNSNSNVKLGEQMVHAGVYFNF